MHRDLGFGKPPESIANPHADLMRFYGVSTIDALIAEQDGHIASLQARLPKTIETFYPPNLRQG